MWYVYIYIHILRTHMRACLHSFPTVACLAELVSFNGGRVQPQSLEPKHALVFRVEGGGHMVGT